MSTTSQGRIQGGGGGGGGLGGPDPPFRGLVYIHSFALTFALSPRYNGPAVPRCVAR